MGLGFTLSLTLMGSIREIIGSGSIFGLDLHISQPMTLFIMPAGGFFVLGMIIAVINKVANKKPPQEIGCKGCPNASACKGNGGCNQ
jgi:electron transport complex protein RnfE